MKFYWWEFVQCNFQVVFQTSFISMGLLRIIHYSFVFDDCFYRIFFSPYDRLRASSTDAEEIALLRSHSITDREIPFDTQSLSNIFAISSTTSSVFFIDLMQILTIYHAHFQ